MNNAGYRQTFGPTSNHERRGLGLQFICSKLDWPTDISRDIKNICDATMTVCKKCQGKGAVKAAPYPSSRDLPCFWFAKGVRTCPTCDCTGEEDGMRKTKKGADS